MNFKKISCPNIRCNFIGNLATPELAGNSIKKKCPKCEIGFIVKRLESSDGYNGIYLGILDSELESIETQSSTITEKFEETNVKASSTKKNTEAVCHHCGNFYDIKRKEIGFNYCLECGDEIATQERKVAYEPLGTREDFKTMSGRARSNSQKDKIT